MGIAIHNVSATTPGSHADVSMDLAAAVRQDASGLLGTTVQYADLVSVSENERGACRQWDERPQGNSLTASWI